MATALGSWEDWESASASASIQSAHLGRSVAGTRVAGTHSALKQNEISGLPSMDAVTGLQTAAPPL